MFTNETFWECSLDVGRSKYGIFQNYMFYRIFFFLCSVFLFANADINCLTYVLVLNQFASPSNKVYEVPLGTFSKYYSDWLYEYANCLAHIVISLLIFSKYFIGIPGLLSYSKHHIINFIRLYIRSYYIPFSVLWPFVSRYCSCNRWSDSPLSFRAGTWDYVLLPPSRLKWFLAAWHCFEYEISV